MALTEEQLEHFYREGYLVVPGLVPQAAIDRVLAAVPTQETNDGLWQARIFRHETPEIDAQLHSLLVEPNIVDAARSIFESEPRVYYGMLAIVPAHGGNGLPWHQDNQYSQLLYGAINIFMALCDITPDKAILWVAPKSHLAGVQPSKPNADVAPGHREAVVEPENGMPLPAMRKGDVAIFDRSTFHRSLKNETNEHRYAYAAQYQADSARQAWDGKKDPKRMRAADLKALWAAGVV